MLVYLLEEREISLIGTHGGTRGPNFRPFSGDEAREETFQVTVMINHHGVAGSDDPDESTDAAAYDDRGQSLVQDHRHHSGALRQDSEGCETAWRIHGGDPGAEMLLQSAQIDVQVRRIVSCSSKKVFKKYLHFWPII